MCRHYYWPPVYYCPTAVADGYFKVNNGCVRTVKHARSAYDVKSKGVAFAHASNETMQGQVWDSTSQKMNVCYFRRRRLPFSVCSTHRF